jgi:excisionase family DNA binding protein
MVRGLFPDAAKLLGNIHIKTLQRYARRGNLPGYQIGGHWYFRVSELDSWLRSRLNSHCQLADRVDFIREKIP